MRVRVRWASILLCYGVAGQLQAQRAATTSQLVERLERAGGRVIVGLRPAGGQGRALSVADAVRISADLRSLGFTPRRHFRIITAVSGTIAPGKLRALRAHPNVEYVQPDYPNSVDERTRVAMSEITPYGIDRVRAREAWSATSPPQYGDGVKVGIMDTGGDPVHEDLTYAGGYDVITQSAAATSWADTVQSCHGHGTHVGGTVAATRENNVGVVGVAPGASLYAIKIFEAVDWDGSGDLVCLAYTSSVLAGFDWAMQNGIQVINMSFGKGEYDEAEHQAIQAAVAQGIVLVASAGNSGFAVGYPAANPEVIAVAATDSLDFRADFSSWGPQVDVAAPGVDVYSTLPNNSYASYSGTSMAAPHVTGLVALLRGLNPNLTVAHVRTYITAWAVDLGPVGVDDEYGFGRIDALASVTALQGPPPPMLSITRQPDGAVWGHALTQQPVVQLVDANGVPVAQAGVRVSVNVSSGTGQLSGMSIRAAHATRQGGAKAASQITDVQAASMLTDQNGVAEFTSLTISGSGPHVLEFSAPGHVAVSSQEFTVAIPPPMPLSNGVPVTGIAGTSGSVQFWVFSVPAEAVDVAFTTSEGFGDPDLYVRRGGLPDFYVWDCRSWSYTTYESCSFQGDVAGDWYIMVHAYDDFGGVTLSGTWRPAQTASALQLTQQPLGAPAGQLLQRQPVVQLYDEQQQPVQQPGVTVTVTANRDGILGDVTAPFLNAVTDAQGRATFDGLLITEQGTHTLIFSTADLPTVTSQGVVVTSPLPPGSAIGAELTGGNQLLPEQEAYLDAMGNVDGVFNLGDFIAYLDRAGATGSPPVMATAPAPNSRGRKVSRARRVP